jgi:hypothetical protein
MNVTLPFTAKFDQDLYRVNIKDFNESRWIGYFVTEIIFICAAIALALLSCTPIKKEIEVREHEKDRIIRNQQHTAREVELEKGRAFVNTELELKSVRVNVVFNEKNKEDSRKNPHHRKFCLCFGGGCCIKFGNAIAITINVVLLIFDLYTFISEALVLKNSRFLGTQFIIYDNSYIINSEYFIYDRNYTQKFLESNDNIPYSSIQNHIAIILNSTDILPNCYHYNTTEEIDRVRMIYKLQPGSFTLLILNLFANAGVIYLDVVFIFVWNLLPNKWSSILLAVGLKAFTSAKLGFSFFYLKNECLAPINFFSTFYYVYIIYAIAYLIVWLILIAAILGFSVLLCKRIKRREASMQIIYGSNPPQPHPSEKKTFIIFMTTLLIISAITLGLLFACGLIGFIIFKIIWFMDSWKSLVPAITSTISIIGGAIL